MLQVLQILLLLLKASHQDSERWNPPGLAGLVVLSLQQSYWPNLDHVEKNVSPSLSSMYFLHGISVDLQALVPRQQKHRFH